MQVTFLEAKMALSKQFQVPNQEEEPGLVDKAYPRAANFKTHSVNFEDGDIKAYHEALTNAASEWWCLLKGEPKHELETFSSRRKLTERTTKTRLLVLDIDGLPWDVGRSQCSETDIRRYAEDFVQHLPEEFSRISYVALASSSMAYKSGLRMHLHFLLDEPTAPDALRSLITKLNFEIPYVEERLQLTPAKMQLQMPIDPCVADNSRLVYIAPPIFGDITLNPFGDDRERIVLVDKGRPELPIKQLTAELDIKKLQKRKENKIRELQNAEGIEHLKPKTASMLHRGQKLRVLNNPNHTEMEIAEVNSEFVRYNINGGDSNAYWVFLDNPEIVFSFKPDELPFSFKHANPEMYEAHLKQFAKQITKAKAVEHDGLKFTPLAVWDSQKDQHFSVKYDPFEDRVITCCPIAKGNIGNYMLNYGLDEPELIPEFDVIFDPTNPLAYDSERKRINTYAEPLAIRKAPVWESDPLAFGDAAEWMEENTPIIYQVMMNMLGDDALCFEQFVNWFAFMVQRKEKPETAWVVHGVEGTGKGVFIKRIAKPLLGGDYVTEKKLADIAGDKFNGYMAHSLLLFVDEFNIKNARNSKEAADFLKQQITEPTLTIREMQQNPVNRPTFFGMMFASNDADQMRISFSDRRYNVAPRQETPLSQRISDLQVNRKKYDELMANELGPLAAMLTTFDISEHRVRTPLENEAKNISRTAGLNQDEMFFKAMRDCDLSFFDHIPTTHYAADEMMKLQVPKQHIMGWVADCLAGNESFIDKGVLKILFTHMTGIGLSDVAFGRKCKQFNLEEVRPRIDGYRKRGFLLTWQHSDTELLEQIVRNHPLNNVKGI